MKKENDLVETGKNFDSLLHKELCLGQTRFVCRWGTLSDGHDKVTDAQRYYQAIREMYSIAHEIENNKCRLLEAEADLIDAKALKPKKESDKLRKEAKTRQADTRVKSLHITISDQMRMLDEYNKVRLELQDQVRAKYPEGIEQAELDNWKATAAYWANKKKIGAMNTPLTHVPLPPEEKARIGMELGMPELSMWHLIKNSEKIALEYRGDAKAFLENTTGLKIGV